MNTHEFSDQSGLNQDLQPLVDGDEQYNQVEEKHRHNLQRKADVQLELSSATQQIIPIVVAACMQATAATWCSAWTRQYNTRYDTRDASSSDAQGT